MTEESTNEFESANVEEAAQPVESLPEDESVTQSVSDGGEEPILVNRRLPRWILPGVLLLLIAGIVWYLPRQNRPVLSLPTPNATTTAASQLAVLVVTATVAEPVEETDSPTVEFTPTMTQTQPTSADQVEIAAQIDITDLLSSDIPVIDLPSLPNAVANEPLPAVAAEGGKPVVIAAMASQSSLALSGLTLEQFLRKKTRILPAMGFVPSAAEAANLRTIPPTPTPIPVILTPGRSWVNFLPPSPLENDHFWVGRPFAGGVTTQIAAPTYQFGSTGGGRYRIHHGMDIGNPFGTPVLSGAVGEVVFAAPDSEELMGPYNNFYGNTVVIRLDQKLPVAGGALDVFVLYGHLSQINVAAGQRVNPEDVIGLVGMTGIAIGPHLHVEIRVGANTYGQSVNPYLWVKPLAGTGAVAVRLLTADGRTWPTARLSLAQFVDNRAVWARVLEIYPDNESINPDPAWGENSAMDAVPAGNYYIYGVVNGERVAANLSVNAGQTTFVELRTTQ